MFGRRFWIDAGRTVHPASPIAGLLVGIGSIVFFPLLYGAIGFVIALILAWIYNLLAGIVGGIRIEVE